MTNEHDLLNQLANLVPDNATFLRTGLSCIIPSGTMGYSLNEKNKVDGIKIGNIPKNRIKRILAIITRFDELERLVLYTKSPIELTKEVLALKRLKHISLSAAKQLPKELFDKSPNINRYIVDKRTKVRSHTKMTSRFRLFKSYNPNIEGLDETKIKIVDGRFLSIENQVDREIMHELNMFCTINDESQQTMFNELDLVITNLEAIKDPPFEVLKQGLPALKKYYEEEEKQGTEKIREAKIVIVGAGESGKTTLIKKLQDPNHPVPNIEDKRTEGIRVTAYPCKINSTSGVKELTAHIWDFGGQEIYHTTHQLFLTADTLYILLNDNRKNDTDFYYWLNIVTLRAGDKNPILMVFNAKDSAVRQIIPGEEIFVAFPNLIKDGIDINFADKEPTALRKMKHTIERYFSSLDVLEKPFPAYWVKVRDSLIHLEEEHIDWNRYKSICENNGIQDLDQMRVLAKTLNNLGVLLYFPDIFGLDNLLILKSQWCIDAIYSALDTQTIIDNNGKFNETLLAKRWAGERFHGNHLQLLKIMQHFDLCYKIDGTHDYIAPQLLSIKEKKLHVDPSFWEITFQFEYLFMPAGLLTRLIARMSMYIKGSHAWRAGVVLEWPDGTTAEIVEHQLTHKIVIKIKGLERKRRLLDLRRCLYDLQKDFKGLKFEEAIYCNCSDCKSDGEITVFELKALEDDAQHNDAVTCRNGQRKKILAKNVLEGISYDEIPRIFISYSHKNEAFKDEFRAMIKPMEKEGKWKVWDDRWLLPTDEWNYEIIRHLNEANIIVLMITKEFFASDFIYDIEFSRAVQRYESGEALVIGVIVSDCMWEQTPLSKIQILPKDAMPVDRASNRNEIWKAVALKIKETIKIKLHGNIRTGGWNI